jgi:subtilase family serine protease
MSPRFRSIVALMLLALLCLPAVPAAGPESGGSARAAPDLTVVPGSFGISPDPPRLWDTMAINVTVINQGDADAGQFQVAFYLNNTTKQIGTATVNSLNAGATANVSVNWATASTETFAYYEGVSYKLVVKVDYNSRVAESDETNNQFEHDQLMGPPRLPDLSLLEFTLDPASPVKGDLATVNVSFTNVGEAAGKFFRVYAYLDDIQHTIDSVDVGTVNVSEVRNVSLRWDTSAVSVGNHTLLAYVNPEFLFTSIAEPSYSNNNGSRAVAVLAPDFKLELSSLEVAPADLHVGDTINVSWTVHNGGARAAENFTARLMLDGEHVPGREREPRARRQLVLVRRERHVAALRREPHAALPGREHRRRKDLRARPDAAG